MLKSIKPTNSLDLVTLGDGNVALKLGSKYLMIDGDGIVRMKTTLPATITDGDCVGDQTVL